MSGDGLRKDDNKADEGPDILHEYPIVASKSRSAAQGFTLPETKAIDRVHVDRRIACQNRNNDTRADATYARVASQSFSETGNSQHDRDRSGDKAALLSGQLDAWRKLLAAGCIPRALVSVSYVSRLLVKFQWVRRAPSKRHKEIFGHGEDLDLSDILVIQGKQPGFESDSWLGVTSVSAAQVGRQQLNLKGAL